MTETNPNYVPVDWGSQPGGEIPGIGNDGLTDEERAEGIAPMFGNPIVLGDTTIDDVREMAAAEAQLNAAVPEDSDPARETSTLNSAGEPIKVGDRVHHLADAGQDERDTGTVRYVGPVTIAGTVVENGAGVQWDGNEHQTSHHVDLLTVLL